MSEQTAIQKTGPVHVLPTLEELYSDSNLEILSKQNRLNVLLNAPPRPEWVLYQKFSKTNYIPIARQEWLMTNIFVRWYIEVLSTSLIGNSACVTVRVHYLNSVDGAWYHTDGVGAVALQTNEGKGATDFNELKSSAVMMALPAAKSYAFKDAVETLGNLFGKDLNRKESIDYRDMLGRFETADVPGVSPFITPEQATEINKLTLATATVVTELLKYAGNAESVETIATDQYERIVSVLRKKPIVNPV